MLFPMKDGTEVEDIKLGRLVYFDERSRNFPLMASPDMFDRKPRSKHWRMTLPVLNQGREGACVGFGISHELAAYPSEVKGIDYNFALNLYYEAQKTDEWPGGAYPGADPKYNGTSVLAGLKVAQKMGYFGEYRWSFSLEELILGVGYSGPAIMGTAWYKDMYTPTPCCHRIYATGNMVGGHCYLVVGVNIEEEDFIILNSWGANWGRNGRAKISFANMEKLLKNKGEAAFVSGRHTRPQPTE